MHNEWEDRYQEGRARWDRGGASPNLLYWVESGLLKPCRILIPGCGNGYEVVALAEHGFDVVAIDFASTPVNNLRNMLKARRLSAEVIQTDFLEWEAEEPFDAIYEQTSLCALPPDTWGRYEACLYQWLKPGGNLFAQFMQTGEEGGPPFHCDISTMIDLFDSQRWQWSDQHEAQEERSENRQEQLYLLEKTQNNGE